MTPSKKQQPFHKSHVWTAYRAFVDEFKNESDRAAVILGVAKLDVAMYQIVQAALQPTPSATDELLDGDAPLGTFSAKINLLHRLGLIDAGFARTLHMVRKIRNAFAHEVTGCKLDSGAHGDRVKELVSPLKTYAFFEDLREHLFDGKEGPAVDFRIALAMMVARLEHIFRKVAPVHFGVRNTLALPSWAEGIKRADAKSGAAQEVEIDDVSASTEPEPDA